MKLTVLSSNSSGNCYLLEAKNSTLILECGVKFSKIKEALNFDYSKVAGCLVSHRHKDHSLSMPDLMDCGIKIFGPEDIFYGHDMSNNYKGIVLVYGDYFKIDNWIIFPFEAKHDVPTFGYLIHHPEMGNLLFLTDSYYSPFTFKNLDYAIIEANYCEDIIQQKAAEGKLHTSLKDRIFTSHMSIQSCLQMLKCNDLSNLKKIVLCHLSDSNSNEAEFVKKVTENTGIPTHIARPNLSIDFNKTPF